MSHPDEPIEDHAPSLEPSTEKRVEARGLDALLASLLPHLDPAVVRRVLGLASPAETDQKAS